MAHGVSCGMEYMHSRNVVHRDVAARNVLVVSLASSHVKICDFGQSATTYMTQDSHYYDGVSLF